MGEWRPMETAPKGGVRVLLSEPTGYIATGYWRTTTTGRARGWRDDGGMRLFPTYWMPLPAPPQEADRGE